MRKRHFGELFRARQNVGFHVCVGLDTDPEKLPPQVLDKAATPEEAMYLFNCGIVDGTSPIAGAYKPNFSFYEARGANGLHCLVKTVRFIHREAPGVPVILDRKAGDIGNSLEKTLHFAFDVCGADAMTVHPYMGQESLKPLLDREDKGTFVLCRTSNPGADEFQRDIVQAPELATQMPLYQRVAYRVSTYWNAKGNCGLVAGATYPEDIAVVRNTAGDDMPILVPGVGEQGGDLEKAVQAAMNNRGQGFLLNVSRSVLFAYKSEQYEYLGPEKFALAAWNAARDFDLRIREVKLSRAQM